jgi:hypothetical protein
VDDISRVWRGKASGLTPYPLSLLLEVALWVDNERAMTAVQIAYSRTHAIFRGITTVFLLVAGFFMIFFSAPRVPGMSDISDGGVAHADAPIDPNACTDGTTPVDYFVYVDPGCGCGCGCGF